MSRNARHQPCSHGTSHHSTPFANRLPRVEQLDDALLKGVDLGLAAAIFAVPFLLGGRVALGQLVLVALSLFVATCWCLRQSLAQSASWTRIPAGPVLAGALVLAAVQLIPLPPSILSTLSPHLFDQLPLWSPTSDTSALLGVWNTLSLTPSATRNAMVLLVAFVLLYCVTVQRVRKVKDAERLLRWIAAATLLMAVFSIVHYCAGNGKFFWFFQHPYFVANKNLQGSFTNRNHFANFMALGLGPMIWWVLHGLHGPARRKASSVEAFRSHALNARPSVGLRAIALALCVFVGLMSLSRGGAMAISVAGIVCVAILHRTGLARSRVLWSLVGACLFVAACLTVFGYDVLVARLDDFASLDDLDQGHGRRGLWAADLQGIAQFPLIGTGLGSHAEVSPMYHRGSGIHEASEFTHAENGYIQVALETGVAGLLLAGAAIGLCVFWCLGALKRPLNSRVAICLAACAAGLAASFVHSLTDFVWYIPGCMVGVAILGACLGRLWQETHPHRSDTRWRRQIPRAGWIVAVGCLILVGHLMLQNRIAVLRAEPSWNRYLTLSATLPKLNHAERLHTLKSMGKALTQTIRWQPDHPRAHAQLAEIHVMLFGHSNDPNVTPMDVRQVRETAKDPSFRSPEAVREWLSRAFPHRCQHLDAARQHARKSLLICPLQAQSYLYLAQLAFLDHTDRLDTAALTRQAVKVRPFDGDILFKAGQEAELSGDRQKAFSFWKASFRCGRTHQDQLLRKLSAQWPASLMLKTFQPDLEASRRAIYFYRQADRPEELATVLRHYARMCVAEAKSHEGRSVAEHWVAAANAYRELGNMEQRLDCLRQAVACDRASYRARFQLGKCLFELGQFAEAETHFTWCMGRKPDDSRLRRLFEEAIDRRLRQAHRPTPPGESRL